MHSCVVRNFRNILILLGVFVHQNMEFVLSDNYQVSGISLTYFSLVRLSINKVCDE